MGFLQGGGGDWVTLDEGETYRLAERHLQYEHALDVGRNPRLSQGLLRLDPFKTPVSFWGQTT